MWSTSKKQILLLILSGVLVLLAVVGFLIPDLLLPFFHAKNTMDPNGVLTVRACDDGTIQVAWPAGENAQSYQLEILENGGEVLHSCTTEDCFSVLPQLPADRELTVRVTSRHGFGRFNRKGKTALEAALTLEAPQIRNLNWQADAESDTVDVSFDMSDGEICRVYMAAGDDAPVLTEEVHGGKLQMKFGYGEKYAVPAHGTPLHFTFQLEHTVGNVTLLSDTTAGFTLTREHLLGTDLTVNCTDNGENSYTFTWNETRGEYYDVRLSEDGGETWMTMAYIPADRARTYTTPNLKAYTDYSVSVVAVGGLTMPDSEFAAVAETMELKTGAKLLYSTIWPLMEVKVYADKEATQELGTVAAGSAWCVLGREGQFLKIRYDGQDAYIDSEYCMINVAEYLGDLCLYNITNSYSSIYTVHEYEIKKVTGKVIDGYENVQIAQDEYLVPVLFPTAQKLMKAGEAAREQGYTLKIYDSFRPQNATKQIYWQTASILGYKVPGTTYYGGYGKNLGLLDWDPVDEDEEEKVLTYQILMTNNGEYYLGNFLAPGTSRHNFGVALDLTMVDSEGKELKAQTPMHDLSWYSVFKRNNANANTMYYIMKDAGFRNISTEWWHYQDEEIYTKNKYEPLQNGVSWECWVADHAGWRYRLADGSFYANCTQDIDGKSYAFDENGYMIKDLG